MAEINPLAGRDRDPEPRSLPPPDVQLEPEDREDLLVALGGIARTEAASERLLRALGFPPGAIPAWGGESAEDWWAGVLGQLDVGLVPEAYRRLITRLANTYRANEVMNRLFNTYVARGAVPPEPIADPRTCHILIQSSDPDERQNAFDLLNRLSLAPREAISTEYVISFSVNSSDPQAVRRLLERTDLPWTLVPPDGPTHLYRELFIQLPGGTRMRAVDTPAQTTIRELAEDALTPQGAGIDGQVLAGTVTDRQRRDGGQDRLNPDETLAEAGIEEGDLLRVAAESRAGQGNPIVRDDALARVRSQILVYAESGRVAVTANSTALPTGYELEFMQPGFGPPPVPDGLPVRIDRHRLRIQLDAGFPDVPPAAYWLSPIFHPNVFPNYSCAMADEYPNMRGKVCLGMLAESWRQGIDFSEVCNLLVDIAGYRNYDIFEFTTDAAGEPALRRNFYDEAAAIWASTHQDEIRAIGGALVFPKRVQPRVRRHVLHPVD